MTQRINFKVNLDDATNISQLPAPNPNMGPGWYIVKISGEYMITTSIGKDWRNDVLGFGEALLYWTGEIWQFNPG